MKNREKQPFTKWQERMFTIGCVLYVFFIFVVHPNWLPLLFSPGSTLGLIVRVGSIIVPLVVFLIVFIKMETQRGLARLEANAS